MSDMEGKFSIEVEPGVYEVQASYTGYVTKKVAGIEIKRELKTTLDIQLETGGSLTEVVVIGYHATRKTDTIAMHSELTCVAASKPDKKAHKKAKSATAKSPAPRREEPSGPATDEARFDKAAPPKPVAPETAYIDGGEIRIKGERAAYPTEYYIDGKIAPVMSSIVVMEEDDPEDAPALSEMTTQTPQAGLLTAGEWNDLHNWNNHWTDMLADGEIDEYQKLYKCFPSQRYTVMLANSEDFPIADAYVKLTTKSGEIIWEARTDNNGKAELWAGFFEQKEMTTLHAEALVNGKKQDLGRLKPAKEGINRFRVEAECYAPKNVDIVWAVDATGSMGDEIEYLKTELLDVIGSAKSHNPALQFNMGTVFYKDKEDDYITKSSGLSPDIALTVEFIRKQFAGGGGDYPEAVHSALEEAIFNQKWSESAIARICFLVLDASPHSDQPEVIASLQRSIREAARRGIRIVPITASGIQKDTEFLMKFFGLATNGTYVFLTDHSGVGGKHLEPTTDEYKVELLNDLLVRLITEYTSVKTCEGKSSIRFEEDPQQQQQTQQPNQAALYYPNPASTQFTLELPVAVESVTLYDSEGKAVRKIEQPQSGRHTVVVSDLPEGFYTIRIKHENRMQSGKLIILK